MTGSASVTFSSAKKGGNRSSREVYLNLCREIWGAVRHHALATRARRADTIFQEEPTVHWLSQRLPNQYCSMNFTSVSADHSLSGVVRM
jgi:hypothetical protein